MITAQTTIKPAGIDIDALPDNPYLLLTPGPLSTSKTVKAAMLRDWCTWDDDYNGIVQKIRRRLTALATAAEGFTAVLMQGSGTFAVEATITTALPADGRLLVPANGAYGRRIAEIARRAGIDHTVMSFGETEAADAGAVARKLADDTGITHVAVVHCETTTGMLNPVAEIGAAVKAAGRTYIVDAMSSFGGIPMDAAVIGADFLVSSANKCIQGVPGFGFVIARRAVLEACAGRARSLSMDLYDQWRVMETAKGKWRFTSPTHTVRAFYQALLELEEEGGVAARHERYRGNQRRLSAGMEKLGFRSLLPAAIQSPIITAFHNPEHPDYNFRRFYDELKERGFVIYPGKVSDVDTFRMGNIGEVYAADIDRLLAAMAQAAYWRA
ncbi:MAG: 2-aminoethylphosphonate--pyruvate transaminase [Deltaproteobacteria bacterium]|nr:2-aminoethylphosphonate--pyruvate transaminase [Candidatus Anaeroferrophillacea bacterium]